MIFKQKHLDRIFMLLSRSIRIDGLWVGSLKGERRELETVEEALELIKNHDPVRYRQIVRSIRRIWITPILGSVGQYSFASGTCEVDTRYVENTSPGIVALVIVHEATHARLRRFGYTQDIRPRLERLCVLSERAFARKLPDGDEVVAWIDERLANPIDYSDRARQNRIKLATHQAAKELRIPKWLVDRSWSN